MTRTASDLKRAGWPRQELVGYHPWKAVERHSKDRELNLRRERAWEVARKAATILKSNLERPGYWYLAHLLIGHGSPPDQT